MPEPEQTPEQIIAAMPDPQQVVREALITSPVIARGDEPYVGWSEDLAQHVRLALRAAGCPVFPSEAVLWAWVRERLLTDEAADACWEGYADARDEGEDEPAVVMLRGLSAALTHAEQEGSSDD